MRPSFGISLQTSANEVLAFIRELLRQGRRRSSHTDFTHRCHRVVKPSPWAFGRSHLHHDASETPDVRLPAITSASDHLRCHPRNGAFQSMRKSVVCPLRAPKV